MRQYVIDKNLVTIAAKEIKDYLLEKYPSLLLLEEDRGRRDPIHINAMNLFLLIWSITTSKYESYGDADRKDPTLRKELKKHFLGVGVSESIAKQLVVAIIHGQHTPLLRQVS
jgi:hypothetical protein